LRPDAGSRGCLLIGVDRKSSTHLQNDVIDPQPTRDDRSSDRLDRTLIGHQKGAIEKTCRSKRTSSFLICTRMLSNAALAARAARSASRAAASPKVHCQATSGSLPSPLGCLMNISPAGRPIERRTAEALRRRSRTSAAKPGLAKYCVRSTIMMALVGIIVPCPSASAGDTTGRAVAPAARCRNCRRRVFIARPW
jgi:hypothetical protein